MQEQQLKTNGLYEYGMGDEMMVVEVTKVTDSTVFFRLAGTTDKPAYVRKNTFISRAAPTSEEECSAKLEEDLKELESFGDTPIMETVFVAGRQCGKRTMVAELTEKWVKKFKKDLRYGSRKAKNEARRALRA